MKLLNEVNKKEMSLYHGSPHSFRKFDLAYLSTGFGQQSHGYGVYLTDSPDTANAYSQGGYIYTVEIPSGKYLSDKSIGQREAYSVAVKFFNYYTKEHEYGREAYEGCEKEFWDYECSCIAKSYDGTDVYGTITSFFGSDKNASEWLRSIGYIGLIVHANNSETGEKFKNYVIFDTKDIKVVKRRKLK